jgi:hypothetical protein
MNEPKAPKRTLDLASDMACHAWVTLDHEPELSGEDVSRVATAVEMVARMALCRVKGDAIDPQDRTVLERMLGGEFR